MAMTPCIEPFFFSVVELSSFAKKSFFLMITCFTLYVYSK